MRGNLQEGGTATTCRLHQGLSASFAVQASVQNDNGRVRLEDKVAFLSSPGAYPERPSDVELIETHMAWVFLTDHHVYKLKKPVKTPVLDFSTLDRRRVDCREEVRLNRRLAPDVYVGVVPVVASPDGSLCIGPRDASDEVGEVVDWLVHMRRLPADRMLDALIREGALREADLCRFADHIARFYRDAPAVGVAPGDYHDRYYSDVAANYAALREAKYGLPEDLVERAMTSQLDFLVRERALVESRSRHVIEAHGDLRPEHVCLVLPEPVVIDCLEFDRSLRLLDPVDELAFLSMECARLGARSVKRVLLDAYASATGDSPPEQLVRFYTACRATLRAKLCVWHLDDDDARVATIWVPRAVDYLQLAHDVLARAP